MDIKDLEIMEDSDEAFKGFALNNIKLLHKDLTIASLSNNNKSFDLIDPKVVFGNNELFIYCSVLNVNKLSRVSLKVFV